MAETTLDMAKINDWPSFHTESANTFGFPDFYGHNLDAWIDCLTYLPDGDGMSRFVLGASEQLFIRLLHFDNFSKTQPEIWLAFSQSVATVNRRYISEGDIPRLVLIPQ